MTLVQKELKAVYLGDTKVRPSGWKPGSDVIAYFPLNTEYQNKSIDGTKTMGTTSNMTFHDTYMGYESTGTIAAYYQGNNLNECTIFGWLKYLNDTEGPTLSFGYNSTGTTTASYNNYINITSTTNVTCGYYTNRGYSDNYTITNGWHSFVMVLKKSNTTVIYIDGTDINYSRTSAFQTNGDSYLKIRGRGYYAKVGYSSSLWTASQAKAFHDGTKSDFGL